MDIRQLEAVIGGRRYRTDGATLIARERWPDEEKPKDGGLATTLLFRTGGGRYFRQIQSHSTIIRDQIEPVTLDEARNEYLGMPVKELPLAEAFPDLEIEEA